MRTSLCFFLLLLTQAGNSLGHMPSDLNHPTGSAGILMVDKIGSHVRFFDPSSFQQIADVIVPARPHDLVFSPDHRRAYITIYGDGVYGNNPHPGHQVVVIDTVSHKLIDTIDLAPYRAPHGIQIDSEGNLLIACDLDRKIIVVDPATHKIVKTMDTIGTDHWIALLHDEKKIYTSNKNDQDFATVVSTSTNIPIARIPIRGGAQGLSASPDGKRVAILSFKDPSLLIVDSRNDSILSTIPLQGQSAGAFKPAYSPDGRWLIVLSEASNSMNIFRADDVGGVQTVLKTGKDPMSVAFSPDGNTALIANHGDGSVSVLNLRDLTITSSFHAGDGIETLEYF